MFVTKAINITLNNKGNVTVFLYGGWHNPLFFWQLRSELNYLLHYLHLLLSAASQDKNYPTGSMLICSSSGSSSK